MAKKHTFFHHQKVKQTYVLLRLTNRDHSIYVQFFPASHMALIRSLLWRRSKTLKYSEIIAENERKKNINKNYKNTMKYSDI